TEDITLTAEFTESTYSVTFAETPAGTFSDITGVTEENGSYTAVYNTDVTFTFTANDDYEISEIYFTADGTKHSLNDKAGGSYTIPGSEITGTISVIVESSATRTFTFTVNPESGGSLIGTTAFTLLLGKYLTEEQINSISVIAPTGYSFKGWRITAESNVYNSSLDSSTSTDLVDESAEEVIIADDNLSGSAVEIEEYEPVEEQNAPVETTPSVNVSLASLVSDRIYITDELLTIEADRNITFEAVFELTDYSVSDENSAVTITDGVDDSGNAHYGTDVKFTLTGDKIISYVGYKTGENGTEVKLTADENGVFTIPGSAVTDNIYIITTVVSDIEITFISHDDYLGEAVTAGEGRKIAILSADLLDSGTYALTSGREFLYSEKYGAYVMWVDEDTTAEALSAEITINLNGTTAYVDYSGDINGSGSTTEADAGMLSDILANNWTKDVTDSQLFSLDVEQAEAPKQIYTSDAVWILLNNIGTDD
ncbi:MAG: hypothetical protein LIO44_04650, partial [Eubacterium sp.]|nr:hypothetical protein [Eubacterium sp.]